MPPPKAPAYPKVPQLDLDKAIALHGRMLAKQTGGKRLAYPFHTLDCAAKLLGPVLLIHGEKDKLIPIHHAEKLFEALPSAQFVRVTEAGHSDVHQFPSVRQALVAALGQL